MTVLTSQHTGATVSSSLNLIGGLNPLYTPASAGGDTYLNTGLEILHLHNGDTVAHTATVTAQTPCTQGTIHTVSLIIPSGFYLEAGPFITNAFNDSSGLVHITYSSIVNVQVAIVIP